MFETAIEQFNDQDFYGCHDTLEALWMEAIEPDRTFYQGLLQIAVGLYHFRNQNWRGAAILLGEGRGRLESYRPAYENIDLNALLTSAQDWLAWMQRHSDSSPAPKNPAINDPSILANLPQTIASDSLGLQLPWPKITKIY
jgi:predicted metal-dependent hydrolase